MAKKKNEYGFRLVYVSENRERKEAYRIDITTDGGKTWGMDIESIFVHPAEFPECKEANFVSFSIVKEFHLCMQRGYEYYGMIDA